MTARKHLRTRAATAACIAGAAITVAGLAHPSSVAAAGGLSIADAWIAEGDSGTQALALTVRLPDPAVEPVTFRWTTGTGSASSADFTDKTGTGRIAPGQTRTTLRVTVAGDELDEYDEIFYVTVFDPVNATITDGSAIAAIGDNDAPPTISVADVAITEAGDSGHTTAPFALTTSAPSGRSITAAYTTADGTLVAPGDYRARTGTVVLSPGTTRATVPVSVVNDNVGEATKTMSLRVTRSANVDVADGTGALRFTDDDGGPPAATGLVINEVDYDQPGTDTAEFVELYNPTGQAASLDGMSLVMHNGYDDKVYRAVPLKGSVPARGYAVVAAPRMSVASGATVIRFDQESSSIQNGAPDAVTLLRGESVIDSVAYEGGMTVAGEGRAGAPGDSPSDPGAIARTDGRDSGDNAADFTFVASPTPGR